MKTVGTKLDNSEYKIFDFCCQENGLTKSEQLRDLIKNFMDKSTVAEPIVADVEPKEKIEPKVELIFD